MKHFLTIELEIIGILKFLKKIFSIEKSKMGKKAARNTFLELLLATKMILFCLVCLSLLSLRHEQSFVNQCEYLIIVLSNATGLYSNPFPHEGNADTD